MPASVNPQADVLGMDAHLVASLLGDYYDEEYANARQLTGTGIMSTSNKINQDSESYTGQFRWRQPLNMTLNYLTADDPTDGVTSGMSSELANYIKGFYSYGATDVDLREIISKESVAKKVARDFSINRSKDDNAYLLQLLKSIAISELCYGAGSASGSAGLGGQTLENDPTSKAYGFYVDINDTLLNDASGAQVLENLLTALMAGYKDLESPYYYLSLDLTNYLNVRLANLLDTDKVVEGNVVFDTILNGKFRLLPSRTTPVFTSAELTKINGGAGVNLAGTKVSFIIRPEAISYNECTMMLPFEVDRKPSSYQGGGSTITWHRWGHVMHPWQYDWAGSTKEPASDRAILSQVLDSTDDDGDPPKAITAITSFDTALPLYVPKAYNRITQAILPVFHT